MTIAIMCSQAISSLAFAPLCLRPRPSLWSRCPESKEQKRRCSGAKPWEMPHECSQSCGKLPSVTQVAMRACNFTCHSLHLLPSMRQGSRRPELNICMTASASRRASVLLSQGSSPAETQGRRCGKDSKICQGSSRGHARSCRPVGVRTWGAAAGGGF